MIKSKAIDLLQILTKKEFKVFGEFIISPLHNKHKRLVMLYEILKDFHPDFESDELTKENVYSKLFPNAVYKDNLMRKTLSELYAKTLEFLAYINFRKNRLNQNKHLVSELNRRNAEKHFDEVYKDAEDILRYPLSSDEMLKYKHNLELEKNTSYIKKNKFLLDESLLNESDYLIKFFIVKILRRYTMILNEQIYELNTGFKLNFLDEIMNHLKDHSYTEVPAISLYNNLVLLMLNENDPCYPGKVRAIICDKDLNLDAADIYNAYFILNNYYRKKNDKGSNVFVNELFGIYKEQLARNKHRIEEFMHPTLFLNVVRTAARLNQFTWIDNFIGKYIHEIDPHHRDNTLKFANAILCFVRKDYDESLEHLSGLKFNGYYHKLDVYSYMLRIYFELNETEPLLSLMDSFKHTLSRDSRIPLFKRSEYQSFIKFLNYLVKMKVNNDYGKLRQMKSELIDVHCVSCTGWFWDKFKEFEMISDGQPLTLAK